MYQPHEAHVPYILQFMIDYNLYGMSHVNLKNVKFRRDPENPGKIHMNCMYSMFLEELYYVLS
jgi:DNA polymerase zeta